MLAGCYSTGEGPSPSVSSLYFPVGLAVSPGGTALYVANSDFDLRFNAGTVAEYDLARIRNDFAPLWANSQRRHRSLRGPGLGLNPTPILQPGRVRRVQPRGSAERVAAPP